VLSLCAIFFNLDAAVGQVISACGADAPKTLKGLIAAKELLRS
jgi:hypothetical protein